jgi:hypothetical protein
MICKYLYVMQSGKDKYKIGVSSDPVRRMKSVQTGSPDKVIVVFTYWSSEPFYYEKVFHQKFSEYRIIGEWFKFEDKGFINEMINVLVGDYESPVMNKVSSTTLNDGYMLSYTHNRVIISTRDVPRPNNESDIVITRWLRDLGCVKKRFSSGCYWLTPVGIQEGYNNKLPKELQQSYKEQEARFDN